MAAKASVAVLTFKTTSMKKYNALLLALSSWIIISCYKELSPIEVSDLPEETIPEQTLTVKATIAEADDTKTAVQPDGTSIFWTPGDAINLFYGTANSGKFTTAIVEPALTTDFNGTLSVATGTSTESGVTTQNFWGVYPYNAGNTCTGDGVILTIPTNQPGIAGSFADKLNPSVAKSPGLSLAFYNVGSWFIFSVTEEDVVSATLTGHNNENLAGRLKVTIDPVTNRPITEVLDGVKSITMTPKGDAFEAGKQYYMVVNPQAMTGGLELTMTKNDGTRAIWSISNNVTFVRSHYLRKLNADNGLVFSNNIAFADNLVKEICVDNWDTNDDGELSYDEAAAVTSLGSVFKNSQITSFNELVYFISIDKIDDGAFSGCNVLVSVKLPDSITKIGKNAFYNTRITSISIPDAVSDIDDSAFSSSRLESISLPQALERIGHYAFSRTRLTDINFPSNLQTIGNYAFSFTQLESVTIPNSVSSIGNGVFSYCPQLAQFEGRYASADGKLLIRNNILIGFADPSATSVTIPSAEINVESVGECVFAGHQKLVRVTCTCEFDNWAFSGCENIEEFTVLYNCTASSLSDIFDLPKLTHFTVSGEGSNNWYGNRTMFLPMSSPSRLKTITLPKNLVIENGGDVALPIGCQIYGENASADHACWIETGDLELFSFPSDAVSYTLPNTITRISARFWNFDNTTGNLKEIKLYIPSSVTKIAYLDCISFPYNMSFYMLGSVPPTIESCGMVAEPPVVVYVRSAYLYDYQTAWSDYISNSLIELRTY